MLRSGFRRPRPGAGPDDGFTLVEVAVAMVVFTIFVSVSLGLLVRTTGVTRGNLQRTAAANLAAEQIELARSTTAANILDLTRTQQVANTTYTITQAVKYLSSDSTSSVCDGSAATLAYKLVTVTITWPGMGSIQPVRADTLKAFGIGSDGLGTTGALAVGIAGADGTAQSGITVTLNNNSSVTTGDDGCALFVGLAAGSYSATLNALANVGSANTQSVTKSGLGVNVGALTRTTVSYDAARSAVVRFDSPLAGALIPSGLPFRLSSTALAETGVPACPSIGTPTAACLSAPTSTADGQIQELYPAIYTLKAGACTESAPSSTSADLTQARSTGSTVTVPMGAATVKVALTTAPTVGISGRTITFSHASQSGSGCTSGETYTMTSASTGSSLLLPYGAWTVSAPSLSVTGAVTATASGTISLSPTARTSSTVLLVAS